MRRFLARAKRLGTDGRFRLVRQITQDRVGTVWAGEDAALGRDVTIRLIGESLRADDRFTHLFPPAAEQLLHPILVDGALRRPISHPNAAQVFHFDLGGATSPAFVVMELFEGEALGELLRRKGRVDLEVAIHISTVVARAVHAAHESRLVHGGVNTANVLIDSQATLKVFDFGVAAASGPYLLETDDELSRFLAPELLAGGKPTFRSDTFAVGAILWALLTGSLPREIGAEDTEPPLRALADVPGPIARLCGHALSQNPQARPASLEDFASGLSEAFSVASSIKRTGLNWRSRGGPMPPSSDENEIEEEKGEESVPRPGTPVGSFPNPASVEAALRKLMRQREDRGQQTATHHRDFDPDEGDSLSVAEGPEELSAEN